MLTYDLLAPRLFLLIVTPVHNQTMLFYALLTPRPLLIFTPLNYQTILTYDLPTCAKTLFVNIHPCTFQMLAYASLVPGPFHRRQPGQPLDGFRETERPFFSLPGPR